MKARRIVLDWLIIVLSVSALVGLFIPLFSTTVGATGAKQFLWTLFRTNAALAVTIAMLAIFTGLTIVGMLILAIDDLCFRSIAVKNMSLILSVLAIALSIITFVLSFVYSTTAVVGTTLMPFVGIYMLCIASFVAGIIAIVGNSLSIPSVDSVNR